MTAVIGGEAMETAERCCDPGALTRLLADALAEAERAEAIGHLDRCEPCRRALEALAADDAWWDGLR